MRIRELLLSKKSSFHFLYLHLSEKRKLTVFLMDIKDRLKIKLNLISQKNNKKVHRDIPNIISSS